MITYEYTFTVKYLSFQRARPHRRNEIKLPGTNYYVNTRDPTCFTTWTNLSYYLNQICPQRRILDLTN